MPPPLEVTEQPHWTVEKGSLNWWLLGKVPPYIGRKWRKNAPYSIGQQRRIPPKAAERAPPPPPFLLLKMGLSL